MFVYMTLYGAGMLFASSAHSFLSGGCLILAAMWLYYEDYKRSGSLVNLRGLFALFFIGGEGISCLKLSRLGTDWSILTWASFFVAFTVFWLVYELRLRRRAEKEEGKISSSPSVIPGGAVFLEAVVITTAVSLSAFLLEAHVLGFIPFLIRGVPHAYSTFHITGVHYFTVSCVLIPPLSILYFYQEKEKRLWKNLVILFCDLIGILIPILCVSRFQLMFGVFLAVLTFMTAGGKKEIRYLVIAFLALIPLYVVLTIARSHDVTYLNGIFEMKDPDMPIFITQPYMYIANNYDNFNCLVEQLPEHSMGLKSLFPVWALTGLKFVKPELTAFPLYITKEELTTVTLFYDAYYDFGILGVAGLSAILGAAAHWLTLKIRAPHHPIWDLFYAQLAMYLMLSFFTTWFSNPTTWYYFLVTAMIGCYVSVRQKMKDRK